MGGPIEQYMQTIVVDKIAKECKGIKNNLEADCNEIKAKLNGLK